jgi:2-keto-4-pentenoate hydratase
MTPEERVAAAAALARAQDDCRPIAPLISTWPDMDVVDAYEIQLLNVTSQLARGAVVKGHKVGLSSRAMQSMMGVREPDYGHLLGDMFVFEGDSVPTRTLCAPRVEVEVAFVLRDRLSGPACTVADVIRATDVVLPAIEIIDSRIADWKISLRDTIADNASSARVVLGGNPGRLTEFDVRLTGVLLWRNGEIVETGAAGAVLGNPASAVAWLANKLHTFGISLDPGHVIMPGSCTRAVEVRPGDHIVAEFDRLGSVTVSFE